MQNIWAWVAGAAVIGGIAVTVGRFVAGDDVQAQKPVPAVQQQAADTGGTAAAPKPSDTFKDMKVTKDDFIRGKDDAKVTLVEYASLTCPHCAHFHNEIMPVLKKEYVDTGKMRIVYRDFPLDKLALTGSVVARCAGRDRFFGFLDAFYASQATWARDNNPLAAMARIARLGGMDQAAFDACLKRDDLSEAVLRQRLEGDKTFGVNATPSIYIDGGKYGGGLTIPQYRAIIDAKLK
jgi:protein-disulfide isomerase